jgi:osmotically-inducible protein OsmY
MKSSRLIAIAALFGAVSIAMPMQARAQDNSVEAGAKEMYHGAKTDVKDTGITTKIKTALDTDPITKSSTIHVDTDQGVVTLSGDVPSMAVSNQAKRIAKGTEHVRSVKNELKVQNASNPPNSSSGM